MMVFSMIYLSNDVRVYKNNTTGATSGAGTTYPSTAHEFTLDL